ncbi:ethanolamine ammonia-lyase subunit EutC [Phenylobacterium sp.]|uniref:ethanolamine ammonia-lyase subunit EutC n=1 Tax=Phenylobacterium sp. TaxID=1871053 RepID=UPI00286A3772|nr:ethanolamine ammonia-lyase subunit EutC [Phenylobacterium sp.]
MGDTPARDPFAALRAATPARVALGRAGQGLPTAPMLAFQLAHARARDAVHAGLDVPRVRDALAGEVLVVRSVAADRAAYLMNPDLGRRPGPDSPALPRGEHDLAIIIADGLSALAVHAHAAAVVAALGARLTGWRIAPVVIAHLGRVAIGDPIGAALGARLVVVLIGERPGLSAADSLGAYITFDPKPGRRDSERNCVSNIRDPGGLSPGQAADKIAWLLAEARRLGFTGVELKDREGPVPRNDQAAIRASQSFNTPST